MLPGFTSRWSRPTECATASASAICRPMCTTLASGRGPWARAVCRLSVDKLHHKVIHIALAADVIHGNDIRMVQLRKGTCLSSEAFVPWLQAEPTATNRSRRGSRRFPHLAHSARPRSETSSYGPQWSLGERCICCAQGDGPRRSLAAPPGRTCRGGNRDVAIRSRNSRRKLAFRNSTACSVTYGQDASPASSSFDARPAGLSRPVENPVPSPNLSRAVQGAPCGVQKVEVTNCDFKLGGARRGRPYAFTEQRVAMLSSGLRSQRAIRVNIAIMRTFVRPREMLRRTRTSPGRAQVGP